MRLYNFGKVSWQDSQLIYHALARMGRESLVLLSPATPYVCIGCHQDVNHEVDLDFCRKNNIPVFRREVGGGAVYLDGNQLFFQLVLRENNPVVPPTRNGFYRKFLQPAINVYRRIGICAHYKPVNDIIVQTRKISGTGVGEIGGCVVFVGNLILDFDYSMMSRVLKVPDEKFRDKLKQTIEENLTTIRRELGPGETHPWDETRLNAMMAEEFQTLLGPMTPAKRDDELTAESEALGLRMINDDDWLHRRRGNAPRRSVKIRSGLYVNHRVHKAPGGLMRADFQVADGRLNGVSLSGDFFCYPPDGLARLESMLEGQTQEGLERVLDEFFGAGGVEIPGVDANDWMQLLKR